VINKSPREHKISNHTNVGPGILEPISTFKNQGAIFPKATRYQDYSSLVPGPGQYDSDKTIIYQNR
jgi:hypothetical protein